MTIRIQPPAGNSQETSRVAKLLLEAAGDDAHLIKTVTDGPSFAFLVPDEIASKVHLDPDVEATDEDGEKVSVGKKKTGSKKGNA